MSKMKRISINLKLACLYYYASLHYQRSIDAVKILSDNSSTEEEQLLAVLTLYYMIRLHLFYPLMFNPETEATYWSNLQNFVSAERKTKKVIMSSIMPFLLSQMKPLYEDIVLALKRTGLWTQAEELYNKNSFDFDRMVKTEYWGKPPAHMNKFMKVLEEKIARAEKKLDSIAM